MSKYRPHSKYVDADRLLIVHYSYSLSIRFDVVVAFGCSRNYAVGSSTLSVPNSLYSSYCVYRFLMFAILLQILFVDVDRNQRLREQRD